jgi:diadenosine tetraphosphatase ApaH/serine/threonine PP2A family protein phosphatase
MAVAERAALGAERLAWLSTLPRIQIHNPIALVHASRESTWRAPAPEASDDELESVYTPLGQPIAVYGHIHRSFIRTVQTTRRIRNASVADRLEMLVANTGSVSLSYDGDRRAAYLLVDENTPSIRRVEYDVSKEVEILSTCGLPHAGWVAKMLDSARPQMP